MENLGLLIFFTIGVGLGLFVMFKILQAKFK